jgi:Type IV secretion-system coupling protein DNA-binding domain
MELPHAYIARTTWGPVSLSREERERHVYIVGKSGSGKSTTLFNLALHDIVTGEGVAVIDPHGDLAEAVGDCIPPARTNQVCYLDAADSASPVGFNPLARVPAERHALAASGLVSAFKHLWRESWGQRLEHFLFNGVMALLAAPHATLIDLPRVYTDDEFRTRLVARLQDPIAKRFWIGEYPQYDQRYRAEAAGPILNKVGQIAASPALRVILGQHAPKFDLSHAMDNRGILIANLAKGRIGEQAANLLGSLLVSHLQLAAMARSDQAPDERVPFFAHIDEFQSFGTDAFASLLSEARKFAAHFCLANQFLDQIDASVRAAVLGNAGALLVFRVSGYDAELLASEFDPLPPSELVDQAPFTAWLRRGIGHEHVDLLPRLYPPAGRLELIRRQSRRNFGRPRGQIAASFSSARSQ